MNYDPKTWRIWSIGVALLLFTILASIFHLAPYWVTMVTSWIGCFFIAWAMVHHIRRTRRAARMATVVIFNRPCISPTYDDEVRQLRNLLTLLVGADSSAFPLRITGSRGGQYLLGFDMIANVQLLSGDGKLVRRRLCAFASVSHPNPGVRVYASLIAQVLALTTDEDAFLRIARWTW